MKLHPLCSIFPLADKNDFERLVEDIAQNGLRDPIVLYQGKVLDGQNRLKACELCGVKPRFKEFAGDDPIAFVFSMNIARRHLNLSEKAAAVAALTNYEHTYGRGGNRKIQNHKDVLKTVAQRAKLSGASREIQRKADCVAKHDKNLILDVVRGNVPLSTAYATVKSKRSDAGTTNNVAKKQSPKSVTADLINTIQKMSAANQELKRQIRFLENGFSLAHQRNWHKKVG